VSYETHASSGNPAVGLHKVLLVADGHREKVSVTVTPAGESIIERKWCLRVSSGLPSSPYLPSAW